MNLGTPEFEKSARRQIRRRIQSTPALRKEYRRVRQARRAEASPWVMRLLLTVGFTLSLGSLSRAGASADALLGLLAIWSTCFCIHYANRLRFQLYAAPELAVLALQPIDDAQIFHFQWQRFIQSSAWLLTDLGVGLAFTFWTVHAGALQWITAIPCALALWMSAVAIATLFVWLRPAANYGVFSSGLFLLVVAVVVTSFYRPEVGARVLDRASGPLYVLPAFGWVAYVVRESVLGSALLPLVLLAPVSLLAPGLHYARRQLVTLYILVATGPSPTEDDDLEAPPLLRGPVETATSTTTSPTSAPTGNSPAQVRREFSVEDVAAVAAIWRRDLPIWRNGGILERLILRWLTPRERNVAEFMTAGNTLWTLAWKRSAALALAAMVAVFTLGSSGTWISYVGLYLAATSGLPLFGTGCIGFGTLQISGTVMPAYAGLPLGYLEIGRFLLKASFVRIAAFAPIALAAGAAVGHQSVAKWDEGLLIAAKLLLLLTAWQPIIVAFQVSSGTNDTRGTTGRTFRLFFTFGPIVVGLIAIGIATIVNSVVWFLPGVIATAAISWGAFRLYGRLYNRNGFDLMYGQSQ